MSFDFKNLNMKHLAVTKDFINNLARSNLSNAMEHNIAYLLKGNILNHKDNLDEWIVLIPKKDGLVIASDKPHTKNGHFGLYMDDSYKEIVLDSESNKKLFYLLMKMYNITIMDSKKIGGRPPSCTEKDVQEMVELRSQGMSNRAIAKQKNMSPATVGKWLQRYDSHFFDIQ